MDLSAEDGQDQGEHGQQVDLPPELREERKKFKNTSNLTEKKQTEIVCTHSITVESVEDPRNITAQDAHRYAGVIQRQPAAAGLF